MSEGEGLLRLDDDVATVLHEIANRHYNGDVQVAMNECLRAILLAQLKPDDPWAAIDYQLSARAARLAAQSRSDHPDPA